MGKTQSNAAKAEVAIPNGSCRYGSITQVLATALRTSFGHVQIEGQAYALMSQQHGTTEDVVGGIEQRSFVVPCTQLRAKSARQNTAHSDHPHLT